MIPCYKTDINGIKFLIGTHDYRNSLYILTNDSNFKINNKTIIGRNLGSFKNKEDIKLHDGWAHFLKIDDYWYAAFNWKKINDDSKVLFVFQYNFDN